MVKYILLMTNSRFYSNLPFLFFITLPVESTVTQLLEIINSSSREFYIFVPDYRVIILYANNKKKELLLKDVMLKIDGVSYNASKKLSEMIKVCFFI